MTQDAVVTRVLPNGMAEVAVARATACGGNCPSCESCIFQSELRTLARDGIGARPGQKVVIETRTKDIFSAAALVYLLPIALLMLTYAVAALCGAGEGLRILLSFLAVLASALILVLTQRSAKNREKIQFEIVRAAEET